MAKLTSDKLISIKLTSVIFIFHAIISLALSDCLVTEERKEWPETGTGASGGLLIRRAPGRGHPISVEPHLLRRDSFHWAFDWFFPLRAPPTGLEIGFWLSPSTALLLGWNLPLGCLTKQQSFETFSARRKVAETVGLDQERVAGTFGEI